MNIPEGIECRFEVVRTGMVVVGQYKGQKWSDIWARTHGDPFEARNKDLIALLADYLTIWGQLSLRKGIYLEVGEIGRGKGVHITVPNTKVL